MTEITLVNSKLKAKVDDASAFDIQSFTWRATKDRRGKLYATTRIGKGKGSKRILMHRLVMNFPDLLVDHRDGDTLNNQTSNLREATHQQNMQNVQKHTDGKQEYKGIRYDDKGRTKNRYRAAIRVNDRTQNLGRYATAEAAARAYDAAAIKHYGDFARLNFPQTK